MPSIETQKSKIFDIEIIEELSYRKTFANRYNNKLYRYKKSVDETDIYIWKDDGWAKVETLRGKTDAKVMEYIEKIDRFL